MFQPQYITCFINHVPPSVYTVCFPYFSTKDLMNFSATITSPCLNLTKIGLKYENGNKPRSTTSKPRYCVYTYNEYRVLQKPLKKTSTFFQQLHKNFNKTPFLFITCIDLFEFD
jgi:hypothetical protein